ncbi:MAG: lytic transglycosylase domain-containing protein [Sterolibacteriaceae bacterium MAG5]|nr:lytic transglycosylase domain-containing protein [Candidatus Nitricoxidireducens bremensis]
MLPDLPPAPPADMDMPLVMTTELRRNSLMTGNRVPPNLQCFVQEADRHSIDPLVLLAVMKTEGGRPGEVALNRNGTLDLGPMSVNTVWLPALARRYRLSEHELKQRLALDGCANVAAAAWILGRKIAETGDVWEGVARYHSGNPSKQGPYLKRVYANFSRIVARFSELVR